MTETDNRPSENGGAEPGDSPEARAEAKRKAKGKIRTIRIWAWVIISLFLATALLSRCAMSKPQAKQNIIESCVQNVPYAPKWQADLQSMGLADQDGKLVAAYCLCMWQEPLDKLNHNQLKTFSSFAPQQQLDLLGGADAFNKRDKQCLAALKGK